MEDEAVVFWLPCRGLSQTLAALHCAQVSGALFFRSPESTSSICGFLANSNLHMSPMLAAKERGVAGSRQRKFSRRIVSRPTTGGGQAAFANDASVAVNCDNAVQRRNADSCVAGWGETCVSAKINATRRRHYPCRIPRSSDAASSGTLRASLPCREHNCRVQRSLSIDLAR